jgi:ribonucleoside-diphosphate reductase alpha chain
MNTANWIPDLFMKRVAEDGTGPCSRPDETAGPARPDRQAFESAYTAYEERGERGEMRVAKPSRPTTCGARCWPCCSRPATRG